MIAYAAYALLGLLPAYAAILYFLTFAFARLFGVREWRVASDAAQFHFSIVIPAHDESSVIRRAIKSTQAIDYPDDKLQIIVVADNCCDETAAIAKSCGVTVWERTDTSNTGKGPALAWTFDRLLADLAASAKHAIIVLDADCTIDSQCCRKLDSYLAGGSQAIQMNHRVSNPDVSPISYAAGVGRTLEYDLGFAPKSRFGLSVMLVGTGMAFDRKLLERIKWNSKTAAEDTEYTLRLIESGVRVTFAADTWICCESAASHESLQVQRTRWAQGNIGLGKAQVLGLMLRGFTRGHLGRFDMGWSLLTASRPLVLVHAAFVILAGLVLWAFHQTTNAQAIFATALGLIPLYAIYFGLGICWLGLNPTRIKHLVTAPMVVWRLAQISLSTLFQGNSQSWERTPRE